MNKQKQLSVMTAVAVAIGATTTYQFSSFNEATATRAIAFEASNNSYQANSTFGAVKVNAKTKANSLGRAQPNDDGYKPETQRVGTGKCGQRQASGGYKGDRRTIKFPAAKGKKTVKVYYDMLSIPDKLQVIYKGKQVLNTGFVSGRKTRSIAFNDSPKEVTVILTGNSNSGTYWTYTVSCPK